MKTIARILMWVLGFIGAIFMLVGFLCAFFLTNEGGWGSIPPFLITIALWSIGLGFGYLGYLIGTKLEPKWGNKK